MFDIIVRSFFAVLPPIRRDTPVPTSKASAYGGAKIGTPDGYQSASQPSVSAVQKARDILADPAHYAFGTEFDIYEQGRHYVARVENHTPHIGGTAPLRAVSLYEEK